MGARSIHRLHANVHDLYPIDHARYRELKGSCREACDYTNSNQIKPIGAARPRTLALRHKFLHLEKDANRHLLRGKLQPIVFRPGKLVDVTLVRKDLFKTSVYIGLILFAHRLVAEDVLGHAGI